MNKMFKLSWVGMLCLSLSVFFACQKNVSDPLLTSAAKGGGGGTITPPPAYVFTLPTFGTACESTGSYCFDASFTTKGGSVPGGNNSITVSLTNNYDGSQVGNDQVVEGASGNFCFSGLTAGQYTVKVYFRHAGSDNAQAVNVPLTFTLTVQQAANCGSECTADGVRLTQSMTVLETDVNGAVTSLNANYKVANCGAEDLKGLKLQGGLVNKASLIAASPANGDVTEATNLKYKASQTNGNTVLTWTFDLAAGKTQEFVVNYSVWGVSCGSPLTGAWSLKNSAGTPIGVSADDASATQAGYLDRLYWNCP